MAGIDVPISFTVVGRNEVESALKSIESRLNELAQTKSQAAIKSSVTKSLYGASQGKTSTDFLLQEPGATPELLKLVEQAQRRIISTKSVQRLQHLADLKGLSEDKTIKGILERQQSPLANFVRQTADTNFPIQGPRGGLNTANLVTAIRLNIFSLRERKRITDKQIQHLEELIAQGDFEGVTKRLQHYESRVAKESKVKNDVKKITDDASHNVQALTTTANAAGTAVQQLQTQLNNSASSGGNTNPAAWAAQAATVLGNAQGTTLAVTGGMGTGGGGGNPTGPGGIGGVPGAPDPVDEYLSRISRRFSSISTSFLKVNEVARGSLRSLTPESVETFLNQFGTTLEEFRNETAKILEQEGAQIGMTPAQNTALGQMIFGTSRRLAGPEFANLNEAEIAQQARLLGASDIAAAFPGMSDEQREKALRIFTTQVAQTTKAYKLLSETVENINVKLGQLNREEANVIVSRIRTERNPALAQQAMEQLNRRRVIFAGQDLRYRESEYGNLSPAELASLSPSVANDIAENRNSVRRNANQALGAPRTAFEQLATLGGRVAAIFSLVQFTVGSTIQTLAQFTDQANRLERVSATVSALAGDFSSYSQALKLAAAQQQKFGGTLEENLQGLSSLIPVSKRYNADLQQLDNIARRLAIVDPLQGFSGAAIALKEFFSGDITSLSRRFEIDRATLNSIKEAGDKAAQLQKLDEVLNKLGISNEVLTARANTTAAKFDRLGAVTSNLGVLFGNVLQNSLGDSADSLSRWLGQWSSLTSQVESDRAKLLEISSAFAGLAPNLKNITNLQNSLKYSNEQLTSSEGNSYKTLQEAADARTKSIQKNIELQQQLTQELSKTQLEVNSLITKYNEVNNTQVEFIKNATTAAQLAKQAATGDSSRLLGRLNTELNFGDLVRTILQGLSVVGTPAYYGQVNGYITGGGSGYRRAENIRDIRNSAAALGTTELRSGAMSLPMVNAARTFDKLNLQQSAIVAEQFASLETKRNELTDPTARRRLVSDIFEINAQLARGTISVEEYINALDKIQNTSYDAAGATKSVYENLNQLSQATKKQAENLAALNKPILSTEVSYQLVLQTIGQIDEINKKQTQTQLEQYAISQRLGDQYSDQARKRNDEFKANRQLLASEEFNRSDLLAKYGEALVLQARINLEQEKSVSIIGYLNKGFNGYNIGLLEAVNLAKELESSLKGIATGSLLSALPISQQLQFQQSALSRSGPFAVKNQNEAFNTFGNIIGLEMKRSDMQRQLGQRLTDIAKDDAEKRQQLLEDLNKDLLKLQEDYEKRKLELLKKSEVDKRQGKVDFYSSLMNADKLTPEQQKMLSGKYETLFGKVSELRNQGQFDKAASLLEAGTTQITNEMNYLQEVATQKENIKEADKDIAKLQEDYNKADSADSRKSILDKIEQRRQDKDTAENRIKQLGEIRTLQTDADNERVKTATEAEDKITEDYNKQVDERKKAYEDALKKQDAAYKKSIDDAKRQSQELFDQNITNLSFITALGTFAETIPNLMKQQLAATGNDLLLKDVKEQIQNAKDTLLKATPETLRTTVASLMTTLTNLTPGFGQIQKESSDPMVTSLDKVGTSVDNLKTSIDTLNSNVLRLLDQDPNRFKRGSNATG